MALTSVMPGTIQPLWLLFAFATACILTGVTSLGADFSYSTLATEMALPIDRGCLWRERFLVTGVGMALLTGIYLALLDWLDSNQYVPQYMPILLGAIFVAPLISIAVGPFTTLLLGDVRAGIFGALIVGLLLSLAFGGLAEVLPDRGFFTTCAGLTAIMAIIILRFARLRFLHFEDYNPFSQSITLPARIGASKARQSRKTRNGSRAISVWQQIIQEVRLQQINLVAFVLGIGAAVAFTREQGTMRVAAESAFLLMWVFPFLFGAAAIAEERRMGILEQRLSLPLSVRTQWLIKFGTNWFLALAIGLATISLRDVYFHTDGESLTNTFWAYTIVSALGILMSLAASNLARNYVEAVGATIALLSGGCLIGVFLPMTFPVVSENLPDPLYHRVWAVLGTLFVGVAGYQSSRYAEPIGRRCRKLILAALAALVVSVSAFGAIYFRTWEYFEPLPPDGNIVLPQGNSNYLYSLARGIAIGPDGRPYFSQLRNHGHDGFQPVEQLDRGTNWISQVSSSSTFLGLKNDGTLWYQGIGYWDESKANWKKTGRWGNRFDFPSKLSRFGSESNWVAVSGEHSRFIGLKKDGSLWQWGTTSRGMFGFLDGTNRLQVLHQPTRVGTNRNWIAVAADHLRSFALADNGELHRWGNLARLNSGNDPIDTESIRPIPEPIPEFAGVNVTNISAHGLIHLADGHSALPFQLHAPPQEHFLGVYHAHPEHPDITVIHKRLDPFSAFRHWGLMPYVISREGQLLKVNHKRSPEDWVAIDDRTTWLESYRDRNAAYYYLNQDGSVWRSIDIIPSGYAKLWRRESAWRRNKDKLIPPTFRLHRVGQLFPPDTTRN